jgi:ABC-type dipeptide/oligopeptide/nickel transport system permease component
LFDYYADLLRGDLGRSLFTRRPVSEDLLARLPATIELTLAAMIVAVAVGIPLGVLSALVRAALQRTMPSGAAPDMNTPGAPLSCGCSS